LSAQARSDKRGTPLEQTLPVRLQSIAEESMSLQPADEKDNHRSADATAKRPYVALDFKKLSPKAALQWLESRSSSSDRATSQQIEELKQYVQALIPEIEDNGSK
jgi:hypothetical protein